MFKETNALMDRAKKHTTEMRDLIAEWHNPPTHSLTSEPRVKHGVDGYRLTFRPNPIDGARLGPIASDVIHNLRVALDMLMIEIVRRTGGDVKEAKFPLLRDPAEIEKAFTGKKAYLQTVPAYIKDWILWDATQAQKCGAVSPLWAVAKLDNAAKHHEITPVAKFSRLVGVDAHSDNFIVVQQQFGVEGEGEIGQWSASPWTVTNVGTAEFKLMVVGGEFAGAELWPLVCECFLNVDWVVNHLDDLFNGVTGPFKPRIIRGPV